MPTKRIVGYSAAIALLLLLMFSCQYEPDDEVSLKSELPAGTTSSILLGAFNVQVFGISKMDKPDVPERLADIITRYDVILIQEIRDISETAVYELLDIVNDNGAGEYELLLSDRLGRTSSKEQYAYFYRKEVLAVLDSYHYDDGLEPDLDSFQREPFLARFQVIGRTLNFSLIAIHTDPDEAVTEVDTLVDVFDDMGSHWQETEVLLLGDFNADCSYVTETDQSGIRLFQDSRFIWWIGDEMDTTTSNTDCAYDRIVTHADLQGRVVNGSAQVFRFDLVYGLSEEDTEIVSDHYPVEIRINVE